MSKRVANTRERTSRNWRVKIGWRKVRMLNQMDKMQQAMDLGKMEDEAKEKFSEFKEKVKAIIPKNVLRRHQAR